MRPSHAAIFLVLFAASAPTCAQLTTDSTPHLARHGVATQLIVDGKPFLILGGEMGNSAATTLESMEPIWPRLVKLHLNTALIPAPWELIEPHEGEFDFALIDGLIAGARQHDMRIVFLWFGSWKNSMSCYAPAWIKTDQRRFPRAVQKNGRGLEILSPFSDANAAADARAFAAFMNHLRQIDGDRGTVLMVQVENEIGMIPDARDWSAEATALFACHVPAELMEYLAAHKSNLIPEFGAVWAKAGGKVSGTWEQVFGEGPQTEEIFMAWHFARYANRVAAAGKREYALPMFANAALIRPTYQPGQYPSAGPLPHLMDVWRAAGPQIDFLSPDIYFPNFVEWCQKYHRSGNPLFIPEAVRGSRSAANAFYAIGQCDAIGVSPFAIDHITDPDDQPLTHSYALLEQLAPLVLEHQGQGTMVGILPSAPFSGEPIPSSQQLEIGGYTFNVTFEKPAEPITAPGLDPGQWLSGGLVIQEGPDEFLVAGIGLTITFAPAATGDSAEMVGIAGIELGQFVDGKWKVTRRLNGDESHQGRHVRLPPGEFAIQGFKLYRFR